MKNSKRIMAMLFAVILGAMAIFSASAFNDVKVEDDAYEAISTLAALGVIHGKTETEYAPNDLVTREEFAALVYRLYTTYSNEGGQNLTPFTDLYDPFYNTMISWCYDQGVVDGTTPTTFEPSENIIYQDALTMVTRLLGYKNLSYPLGYITKARSIGLGEGLDGIAFDKLLTRAEMAKILYNALEAPGKEEVKETIYFENFPITTTRPFNIAQDIYNFKKVTYQIVGTENFNLEGYNKTGEKNAYYLAEVGENGEVSSKALYFTFKQLQINEEVNSDDNIMAYVRVMSRGKIGEKNSVVLGTVITSAMDMNTKPEVVYSDSSSSSSSDRRNPELISINGKNYNIHEIVYTVSENGVISPIAQDKNLAQTHPVFFSGNGKFAHEIHDLNNDGKIDAVLIFEMAFKQIKDITNKGAYVLTTPGASSADPSVSKENVILNADAKKNDYVLVYNNGRFTVIDEVVKPDITNVAFRRGTGDTAKYTLGNGKVVMYAVANNPVSNIDHSGKQLALEHTEKEIYIINDRVVHTEGIVNTEYNPYNYAFIVSQGDTQVNVDQETGSVEKVNTFIGFVNGKVTVMPLSENYDISLFEHRVVTITEVKAGKYTLSPEILVKDAEKEIEVSGQLEYDHYTGLYKLGGKYVNLDEKSEIYVSKLSSEGKYESVKYYTKENMPQNASGQLQSAILRKNANSSVYTLVVASLANGDDFAGTTTHYTGNRIVLSHGTVIENGKAYKTYEVLNVFNGEIEVMKDAYVATDDSFFAIGSIIRQAANGAITMVSDFDDKFESLDNETVAGIATVGEHGVYNGNVVFIDGAERSITVGNAPIFKLSIDENGEYVVEQAQAEDMQGKAIRTYTSSGNAYKMYYAVILPDEWVEA